MAEIIHEVHLNLKDEPPSDAHMMLMINMVSLKHDIERFLKVCPSGKIVSERYHTEKAKLEETLKDIKKMYGWR